MKGNLILKNASELVCIKGKTPRFGNEMSNMDLIENGYVIIEDGIIQKVGGKEVLNGVDESKFEVIDCTGKCVLPGFVDSHTHFIFGGYRAEEFSWRLKGESYMSIMNKGGGIQNTVNATKKASFEELLALGEERIESFKSFGVTTLEGKSGYGLDLDTEIKQLKVMKELNKREDIDVVSTFLGAHAIPTEYKDKNDEYIDFIIDNVLPKVKKENLADFCDVFCEKGVFTVEESRKLLKKARELGFKLKIHGDEIVHTGGGELGGELKAASVDHLLKASYEGMDKMKENKVIATLLPLTAFSLKEDFAKGRDMIDRGLAVALASDFNPGSCFSNSIPLLIGLSTIYMKLSIEETLCALTLNGACALSLGEKIGSIEEGKAGDICILKYPSYKFLPYNAGVNIVKYVIKNGNLVKEN